MEQRKFLAMVGPLAQADMQKSGILASLTIAQAILESGWGTSELATKANALFGIKADARWSGRAYSKDTKECYDGVTYTTITALFRAYDSWAESVADHSAFLLANKRYAAVVGERDYKVACKAIKAAGYATDPGYPQKLIGLIEKYGLTVYDGKAEQEDKTSMNISITKKTSTHNTTAAAGRAIRYIVVHYTAGVTSKPGSAAGTASYFGGTSKQVSADFIVDDGGAVQYNGDIRNRYTWHCGGGKYNTKGGAYYGKATNRNTIGIEVCSTNDTGKMTVANDSHWRFTDKVVSNLVELVKYLMAEYGIDAAHVIRHYDVNGKPCPGIIGWNEDTGSAAKWAAFKARLGAATTGGQTGGSTNTGTATGNTALTYKVGDIVQFAGGKHYANAQADQTNLNQIGADLVADDVDVIVAVATPTAATMLASVEDTDIPVVYSAVTDPVSAGFDGEENITGTSDALNTDAIMNLILAVNPDIDTIGLLYDLSQDASTQAIADAKAFCDSKGIQYIEKNGTTTAEVQMAAEALVASGVKAVFTPTDNTVMTAELSIYETFTDAGVMHFTGADSFALNGAFVGYGVDYVQLGEATADMVVELLCDGKTTADLPYQTFDNGIVTINTETAAALGMDDKTLDMIKEAFKPYCTEIVAVTTQENF